MRTTVVRRDDPPRHRAGAPGALASTLFGQTRQRVLGLFFGRPDEAYYVRDVARRTGGALGAVQRELAALVAAGILERSPMGRQVYYRAHRQCPVFEELRSIVAKTSGLADILRGALLASSDRIDAAFIFGSMASTGGTSDSDVDVFVVGRLGLGAVVDALAAAESQLEREVNPVVQSAAEFARRTAAGDHFVTRVLAEPRMFLFGGESVLGRLAAAGGADAAHDKSAGDRRSVRAGAARPARQPRPRRQR